MIKKHYLFFPKMIAPEKFIQPVPTSTESGYACCVLVSIVQIFKLKFRCLCTLVLDVKKKFIIFVHFTENNIFYFLK